MVEFVPRLIDQMLPLIVFCSYSSFGNKITLAQIIICEEMIRRLNGSIGHVIHHYNDWENLQKSLHKVHDFYHAHELQKGVVNKDKNSELAISLKGNFSRGINLDDEEEKEEEPGRITRAYRWVKDIVTCKKGEKEEGPGRITRAFTWVKNKMTCKKGEKEKADNEKSEEDKKEDKKEDEKKKKSKKNSKK